MRVVQGFLCVGLSVLLAGCPADEPDVLTYTTDIKPIINEHCGGCHAGDAVGSGGIAFASDFGTVAGTAAAEVCAGSSIFDCIPVRVRDGSMPLDGCALDSDPSCISTSDVELIETWVAAGAPE